MFHIIRKIKNWGCLPEGESLRTILWMNSLRDVVNFVCNHSEFSQPLFQIYYRPNVDTAPELKFTNGQLAGFLQDYNLLRNEIWRLVKKENAIKTELNPRNLVAFELHQSICKKIRAKCKPIESQIKEIKRKQELSIDSVVNSLEQELRSQEQNDIRPRF